jgi:hypothetical protein
MTVNDATQSGPKILESPGEYRNQPKHNDQDQKRSMRKRKAPVNFRLNKILVRAESSDEVLGVVGEHLSDFNIVNIGTALYRLALVGGSQSPSSRDNVRNDDRFIALIKEIVETLEVDSERDSLQQVRFLIFNSDTFVGCTRTKRTIEYNLGSHKTRSERRKFVLCCRETCCSSYEPF